VRRAGTNLGLITIGTSIHDKTLRQTPARLWYCRRHTRLRPRNRHCRFKRIHHDCAYELNIYKQQQLCRHLFDDHAKVVNEHAVGIEGKTLPEHVREPFVILEARCLIRELGLRGITGDRPFR